MMNLYAVRDVKADTYIALHPAQSDVLAQRGLLEVMANPQSDLAKYPEEYQLYQLGTWEANSGQISPLPVPRFVVSVVELARITRERMVKQAQEKAQFEKRYAEATGQEVAK